MGIRAIKKISITCDNCKKVIATGKTSTDMVQMFEQEEKYTEMFCTDCVKLPPEESNPPLPIREVK